MRKLRSCSSELGRVFVLYAASLHVFLPAVGETNRTTAFTSGAWGSHPCLDELRTAGFARTLVDGVERVTQPDESVPNAGFSSAERNLQNFGHLRMRAATPIGQFDRLTLQVR